MNWRELLHKDIRQLVGLEAVQARLRPGRRRWAPRYFRKNRYWRDLLAVTRILEGFIQANVPLVGGLEAAAQDAPRFPLWCVMTGHKADLSSGLSLSESIRRNPTFFPGFYADLVQAGEESGTLKQSFTALREIVQQTIRQRARMRQYRAYLGAVWLVFLLVFAFLGVKVLPVFSDMLETLRMPDPPALRAADAALSSVLAATRYIDIYGAYFYPSFALVVCVAVYLKLDWRRRSARSLVSAVTNTVLLRVPVLGSVVRDRILAHIATVLEKLLGAGMPIDDALGAATQLDVHPRFARALNRVRRKVSGGATLTESFASETPFPESFRGFVSLGERSGRLPEALAQIGHAYRLRADRTERILLDLLSPIGLVAAGAGVLLLFESYLQTISGLCATLADTL